MAKQSSPDQQTDQNPPESSRVVPPPGVKPSTRPSPFGPPDPSTPLSMTDEFWSDPPPLDNPSPSLADVSGGKHEQQGSDPTSTATDDRKTRRSAARERAAAESLMVVTRVIVVVVGQIVHTLRRRKMGPVAVTSTGEVPWLPSDVERDSIAGPLARIAARRAPDSIAEHGPDAADAAELAIATAGYAARHLGLEATVAAPPAEPDHG